jgi:cytochrome c-type biogenesis protein CcsB
MTTTFNSSYLLSIVTFTYFAGALSYVALVVFKKESLGKIATTMTLLSAIANTAAIIWRWIESHQLGYGRPPFSNLYESLIFFALTIAVVYLIMEWYTGNRGIGAYVMPLAFLAMAYAGLQPKDIRPLLPALKSNWLIAHVITCFLGYAGFTLAAGLALMYLTRGKDDPDRNSGKRLGIRLPSKNVIDLLIYRNIVFGFLLLTAGIVTGSIWAHVAWGSYWSWDPKETWSLITWLVYAAILHARLVKGWTGRRIAILALVGFACVLFTYFGVNLLLSGLHSYATGK